jgi:putative ABC transport system permease protein
MRNSPLALLEHLVQDLRYASRGLRRTPAFTATVMITLGLGIGANTAMFSAIDRLMFRPFPYLRDPGSVNRVYLRINRGGRVITQSQYPYARYLDLRRWTTSFSDAAAVVDWRLAVGRSENGRELAVEGVSASLFGFFDAPPALGRFFDGSDDSLPRGASVAVLGYGYWKSQLGGRNVVGQTLQVGPLVTTIIGVAPKDFVGVAEGEQPAVFLPVTTMAYGLNQGNASQFVATYNWDWIGMVVRRRREVAPAVASADLTKAFVQSRIAQRQQDPRWAPPPEVDRPHAIAGALRTAGGPGAGLESATLLWVSGVAVIVLIIACANVTNLMVARVVRRRREIAVRLALGATRRRVVSQVLAEHILLALLGCLTGLIVAQLARLPLQSLAVRDGASLAVSSDWHTLALAAAFALGAGLVTAVGPTLFALRGDLSSTLRAGMREGAYRRSRTRSALLVMQSALSVVLLVGAGLFVRSLDNVRNQPLGWDPDPVLIATPNYRGLALDTAAATALRNRLLETARAIPGVIHAARVNGLPFATSTWPLAVPGADSSQLAHRFNYQATTSDYFNTVGTRILRGRGFTSQDRGEAARVAVVSQAMAKVLWPNKDPIGQCFHIENIATPCMRVIGVAEDAVQYSISDNERLLYYMPDEQPSMVLPGRRLFLRITTDNPRAQMERVRRALQAVMPAPAYVTVSTLEDVVDAQRRSWQLGATMFVAFGALALIVAAVGLYGVITYDVAQRMHELAIRIALGARTANIISSVVAQAFSFAGAGVAFGIGAVLLLARWVQPLLFGVSARDPLMLAFVGVVIAIVALLASAGPAARASRADPIDALRSE